MNIDGYIDRKLDGFNEMFVNSVKESFHDVLKNRESDGCLSNSVILYICAKVAGYNPILCYGLIEIEGIEYYHSWLEVNNTVIDLSLYGNINFSPFPFKFRLESPYIGSYQESTRFHKLIYKKFIVDEEFSMCAIASAEGKSILAYANGCPNDGIFFLVCKYLHRTYQKHFVDYLKTLVSGDIIERKSL